MVKLFSILEINAKEIHRRNTNYYYDFIILISMLPQRTFFDDQTSRYVSLVRRCVHACNGPEWSSRVINNRLHSWHRARKVALFFSLIPSGWKWRRGGAAKPKEERVECRDRHSTVAYSAAAGAPAVAAESWNATFLSGFDMQIAWQWIS